MYIQKPGLLKFPLLFATATSGAWNFCGCPVQTPTLMTALEQLCLCQKLMVEVAEFQFTNMTADV